MNFNYVMTLLLRLLNLRELILGSVIQKQDGSLRLVPYCKTGRRVYVFARFYRFVFVERIRFEILSTSYFPSLKVQFGLGDFLHLGYR